MVCEKTFARKVLAFVLVFTLFLGAPLRVHAATLAVGDVFTFTTGWVYPSYDDITFTTTKRIDLGKNYTGRYRINLGFSEKVVADYDLYCEASFYAGLTLTVNGDIIHPVVDGNNCNFNFVVDASMLRYIGLNWNCVYWCSDYFDDSFDVFREGADYLMITDTVEVTAFTVTEVKDGTFKVEDSTGNELQEEANELQETGNELQKEQNKLQEKQNKLQEDANELQEEANETSKGILGKITDFFDNFFTRLGDFFLGLIVPSSEDLSAFLDKMNDWFGSRLGFIWYPFDFAIQIVNAFALGDASTAFQVPACKLNILGTEYTIWNSISIDLDAFGIFTYVRYFTSTLLVCGVVRMAVNKWDEVIGGRSG